PSASVRGALRSSRPASGRSGRRSRVHPRVTTRVECTRAVRPDRENLVRQITALPALLLALPVFAQPDAISVTFDEGVLESPYTGRIYLVLGPKESEPIGRMNAWFNPPPLVAWDVRNVQPGEPIVLEGFDLSH